MKRTHSIRTVETLISSIEEGKRPKYLFFWGHTAPEDRSTNQSCLSQWYPSPFELFEERFQTAEHWMMARKARLFNDEEAARKIIATREPNHVKAIGRTVKNFDETIWEKHRFKIVVEGNLAKFQQYPELAQYLLKTGDRILVEASPSDHIWGIGMAKDNPHVEQPKSWKGLNLLGFALMEVREKLKNELS